MRRVRSVRGSRLHVLHTKLTARAFRLDLFQTLTRRVDANGVRAALFGVQQLLEGICRQPPEACACRERLERTKCT